MLNKIWASSALLKLGFCGGGGNKKLSDTTYTTEELEGSAYASVQQKVFFFCHKKLQKSASRTFRAVLLEGKTTYLFLNSFLVADLFFAEGKQ